MPKMMLGTAASSSTATPMGRLSIGGQSSVRNRAMPKPVGTAMSHRDHRGHHRAVDRRQRAELVGDRIPDLARDERETEVLSAGQEPAMSDKATPPRITSTRIAALSVAERKILS